MQLSGLEALVPKLIYRQSVGSTNTELAALVQNSAVPQPNFTTFIASHQTAGRGRLDRQWQSVAQGSIAISIFLTEIPTARLPLIPLVAALAVVDSLQKQGVGSKIKWPNDVLVEDKKISGILAELLPQGCILGIGLNLFETDLEIATSISQLGLETDFGFQSQELISRLLIRIQQLTSGETELNEALSALTAASATVGEQVSALLPGGEKLTGLAVAIGTDGRLLLENGGQQHLLSAADIIHLRKVTS